jgi:hypothetical protein
MCLPCVILICIYFIKLVSIPISTSLHDSIGRFYLKQKYSPLFQAREFMQQYKCKKVKPEKFISVAKLGD